METNSIIRSRTPTRCYGNIVYGAESRSCATCEIRCRRGDRQPGCCSACTAPAGPVCGAPSPISGAVRPDDGRTTDVRRTVHSQAPSQPLHQHQHCASSPEAYSSRSGRAVDQMPLSQVLSNQAPAQITPVVKCHGWKMKTPLGRSRSFSGQMHLGTSAGQCTTVTHLASLVQPQWSMRAAYASFGLQHSATGGTVDPHRHCY